MPLPSPVRSPLLPSEVASMSIEFEILWYNTGGIDNVMAQKKKIFCDVVIDDADDVVVVVVFFVDFFIILFSIYFVLRLISF